jgi:hypothetical protein
VWPSAGGRCPLDPHLSERPGCVPSLSRPRSAQQGKVRERLYSSQQVNRTHVWQGKAEREPANHRGSREPLSGRPRPPMPAPAARMLPQATGSNQRGPRCPRTRACRQRPPLPSTTGCLASRRCRLLQVSDGLRRLVQGFDGSDCRRRSGGWRGASVWWLLHAAPLQQLDPARGADRGLIGSVGCSGVSGSHATGSGRPGWACRSCWLGSRSRHGPTAGPRCGQLGCHRSPSASWPLAPGPAWICRAILARLRADTTA